MVDQTPRFELDDFEPGDVNWDHSDLVQFVDEHGIERAPIADRPTEGTYPDELYLATDEGILYRWDADAGSWVVAINAGLSDGEDFDGQGEASFTDLESVGVDDVSITNHASVADYVIYTADDGTAKAVNDHSAVAYTEDTGDVHQLINDIVAVEASDSGPEFAGAQLHFHIASGNHKYASTLTLYGGMQITGAGITATRLIQAAGTNLPYAIETAQVDTQQIFAEIEHLEYNGGAAGDNNTSGSWFTVNTDGDTQVTDIHFDHVFVQYYPDHGIETGHSWGHKYTNFLVEWCGGDGIRFVNSGGLQQAMIDNSFIAHNDGWGINTVSGTGGTLNDHIWTVECTNNEAGGVRIGNSTKDSRFDLSVMSNGGSDGNGVELHSCRQNTFDIIAENHGGLGLAIPGNASVLKNIITINGRNNDDGLFPSSRLDGSNLINGMGHAESKPADNFRWRDFQQWTADSGAFIWQTNVTPQILWYCDQDLNWHPSRPVTGTYEGDGTTGRTIDLTFQPSRVVVEGSDGTVYDVIDGFSVAPFGTEPSGELSIASNGFTVGDNGGDADPNTDTETYTYWAAP